jgi:pimeloyl-ACP methyl ester carboxylesterase
VLVTGGVSGIGQAIAVRFAQFGANVAINYLRRRDEASDTVQRVRACVHRVRQEGVRDVVVRGDVSREGDVVRMVGQAVVFTAILFPGIGPVVANVGNKQVLSRIMAGGVYDRRALPDELIDDPHCCGSLPGHPRAFRFLMRNWRSWIDARANYGRIEVPVTLSYGAWDWSRPAERDAAALAIPGSRTGTLPDAGHFSSLEKPQAIGKLIGEAA